MDNHDDDKSLWRLSQVAEYMNMHPEHVRARVACKPDFPRAIRLGRSLRWYPSEIKKYVESNREG